MEALHCSLPGTRLTQRGRAGEGRLGRITRALQESKRACGSAPSSAVREDSPFLAC